MKRADCVTTIVTLANCNDLVANIARGVLGNDVADTFQGNALSVATIHNMVQVEAQQQMEPYLKGN